MTETTDASEFPFTDLRGKRYIKFTTFRPSGMSYQVGEIHSSGWVRIKNGQVNMWVCPASQPGPGADMPAVIFSDSPV